MLYVYRFGRKHLSTRWTELHSLHSLIRLLLILFFKNAFPFGRDVMISLLYYCYLAIRLFSRSKGDRFRFVKIVVRVRRVD